MAVLYNTATRQAFYAGARRLVAANENLHAGYRYSRAVRAVEYAMLEGGVASRLGRKSLGRLIPVVGEVLLAQDLLAVAAFLYYPTTGQNEGMHQPVGFSLVGDGGPHPASTLVHVNESDRTGWYAYPFYPGIDPSTGAYHSQYVGDPWGYPMPANKPLYLYFYEGDRNPPAGHAWYIRANFVSTGGTGLPWEHNQYGPKGYARPVPFEMPLPLEWIIPSLEPFRLPIGETVPDPHPLPWHFPRPIPVGDPLGEPAVKPAPAPRPGQITLPVPPPGVVSVPALRATRQGLKPDWHQLRRWPRKSEGKGRLGGRGGHMVYLAANVITESLDFLNAMWWALPKDYRTPWSGPLQKSMDVLNFVYSWATGTRAAAFHSPGMYNTRWAVNRASGIPSNEAFASWFVDSFKNVTINEVGDTAIGRLARGANQITKNPYYVSPAGVTAGPLH